MMTSKLRDLIRVLALALGGAAPLLAGTYTTFDFNLLPPVAGALPGGTVGWGYSVTNNDTDHWLVLSGLQPTINFANVGSIGDVFDYPTLAPGASLNTPWVQDVSGLYQLTWDPSAPVGYSSTGQFEVDGTWYYADPNSCPTCLVDGPAQIETVVDFTAIATPEPATWGLCLAWILGCLVRRFRTALAAGSRRARSQP
jgi:hypothetical protein